MTVGSVASHASSSAVCAGAKEVIARGRTERGPAAGAGQPCGGQPAERAVAERHERVTAPGRREQRRQIGAKALEVHAAVQFEDDSNMSRVWG